MKAALFLILSLSAVALAGPAFNKDNQIDSQESYLKQQQQQQNYMNSKDSSVAAKGPIVDILKQWCFSSQMSQQELTSSFKKLVGTIKSNPTDQATEQAVMSERICSGAIVAKSQQSGETVGQSQADAKAHELIKDVYMDALIACKSRECTQQLLKLIEQQPDMVDTVRASYYMTRLAVTESADIKSADEIKQLAESFVQQQRDQSSDSVERQKLFAVTSMVGKYFQDKPNDSQAKQIAQDVAKTIVDRYLKPVSQQDVQQYQQEESNNSGSSTNEQLVKKIAKRSAALKALANLPGHLIKEVAQVEQEIMSIAQNKQEMVTVRQSAIECLEQNDKAQQVLKQLTFDQEEPIEVRVAAYRALITVAYSADSNKDEQQKQQVAAQIIDQIVKHCEDSRNQQQDDQFVLYAISHLDNMRASEQPEHQAIKECIMKNKQHNMQIQVLNKKFKQQLADVRRSSRNYKLEQEFNQIESGLVLEGDLVYESKSSQYSSSAKRPVQVLPKLIRVNMSMPVMGKTVNVVEVTVRQNQMDEDILSALKLVESAKFSSESVSKVVDSFKSSVQKQQTDNSNSNNNNKQQATECDLTVKVDGCTVVYLSIDDFKTSTNKANQYNSQQQHQRNTRSVYSKGSIVDDVIEYIKRSPVAFNRGINFSINERIAKLLDIEANVIAGLRFESRAQGHSDNFEIVAKVEPRINVETIVGPAKMSSKKLLQRLSTKTAMGLRLRYKRDELVDVELDLPMQTMELFTVESQIVERSSADTSSYTYLPESIYGQEDIYSSSVFYPSALTGDSVFNKLVKRSIFDTNKSESMIKKIVKGKRVQHTLETSDKFARATGLRGQLRFAAAPKDMSLIVSCVVAKYEPSMQGYRVQVQKNNSAGQQQSYTVSLSTPGSRTDRQVQLQLYKQSSSQRTVIKTQIKMANKVEAAAMTEIVHDGRQYSIKSELVSRGQRSQWRHYAETGVMIVGGSKSPNGRISQNAYKPYVQIESSSLKRPIQLQGTIAYTQSPKSVISYELKCSTTGDYIQGKLIVDQRDVSSVYNNKMRKSSASYRLRRSMQSPLELVLSKDLTLTNELVAQVRSHAVKVHNMIDWDAQKISLQVDSSSSYKNARKSNGAPSTVSAQLKLDAEQQYLAVERKSPEDQRKEFSAVVKSEWRAPASHQMNAELRYAAGRRSGPSALVSYKHKIDINKIGQKQHECSMQFDIVDTERQINEKLTGRARISNERKQKSIQLDISSSRQISAKLQADYESLSQNQATIYLTDGRFAHKTELRNNQRQFVVVSRQDKRGQTYFKTLVDISKQQGSTWVPKELKAAVERPLDNKSVAVDVKFASGQRSSIAISTPDIVAQSEFSFETSGRPLFASYSPMKAPNVFYRTHYKNLKTMEAYWIDMALNLANLNNDVSYCRINSPSHRVDIEFDPREQITKLGAYARSKRSTDAYEPVFSNKNSALNDFMSSHQSPMSELSKLGQNKMWMARALMSSPFARDQLKQQARRALIQYIDRVQSNKHSFEWSPRDQSFQFDLERSPSSEFSSSSSFEPMRLKGDISTSFARPSTMKLDSEFMSADFETSPFDSSESYAKLSALSRHRRSPFKKHESEWRYNKKDQSHKAWMKHTDSADKRHSLSVDTERDPKKWAKMAYESDKHGKASWEHNWRKHVNKRSNSNNNDEDVYANRVALRFESPKQQQQHQQQKHWTHETNFDWQEPVSMVEKMMQQRRYRRSISDSSFSSRYSPVEYLKHTSARLSSAISSSSPMSAAAEPLYKLDFDYKPQLNSARFDISMPDDLLHSSQFDMKPADNLYKLQSKLYNRRTQDSTYDFSASTKPFVSSLATANQEPVFVHSEHPMLERPIDTQSLAYNLFKQPMKLDYSDKYGRLASFDYDLLPISSQKYAGLRQKRAAVYYKDAGNDFEHSSSFDFYPETFLGRMKSPLEQQQRFYSKPNSRQSPMTSGDDDEIVIKTSTKYGPIVLSADTSDSDSVQCELQSPLVNAKLSAETGAQMRKLIKLHLDNKGQRVQLAKLLRKAPEPVRTSDIANKIARKVDSSRLEHDTELLVSIVDAIFKLKSSTELDSRQVLAVDGEWNEQQGKAYAKINGERVDGQFVVDLMRKSAELKLKLDAGKHSDSIEHHTRLERTSDGRFYTIESSSSTNKRPIYELVAKIAAMVVDEPAHVFQSGARRSAYSSSAAAHVSTFKATVYEPEQYQITGMFDCDKKELVVVTKNVDEQKTQETAVRFDDESQSVDVSARLTSAHRGQIYNAKAKLNLDALFESDKCLYESHQSSSSSCASELIYQDKSGFWSAKYQPGEYVTVSSPRGTQSIKLNNYY